MYAMSRDSTVDDWPVRKIKSGNCPITTAELVMQVALAIPGHVQRPIVDIIATQKTVNLLQPMTAARSECTEVDCSMCFALLGADVFGNRRQPIFSLLARPCTLGTIVEQSGEECELVHTPNKKVHLANFALIRDHRRHRLVFRHSPDRGHLTIWGHAIERVLDSL